MDLQGSKNALTQPTRARIFALLIEHSAPLGTRELAGRLGLHPNGVRRHLQRLEEAGLIERRRARGDRGRPSDRWLIAESAHPGGERPSAYRDLSRWLARAIDPAPGPLREVESAGREIGRELAPGPRHGPVEDFHHAIAALGFRPVLERDGDGGYLCRLQNCPYRDSARENADLVCGLHRGITAGLLDRLDPEASLERFEPHDPDLAGCVIGVVRRGSAGADRGDGRE